MAGRRVHVVMSPELVARIDAEAGRLGVSRGELVRQAVEWCLRRLPYAIESEAPLTSSPHLEVPR